MDSTPNVHQFALFEVRPVPTAKDASTDLRETQSGHSGDPTPFLMKPNIGTGQCLCMGCGEIFNSLTGFERHQRLHKDGRSYCLKPADLGMLRNARGLWITSQREMPS